MKRIIVGRFGKSHGVAGWLRVIPFTDPIENIIGFSAWQILLNSKWQLLDIESVRVVNNGVLVKITGIDNCDLAKNYTNLDIYIEREQLPLLPENQYYWTDLLGLTVINRFGKKLGVVDRLFDTGANDVLVVKSSKNKELLVPYIKGVVLQVDLSGKLIKIDYEF